MDATAALCQTCLSGDRTLAPISSYRHLLSDINLWEILDNSGGMCWECCCLVRKFHNFMGQVAKAQLLLTSCLQAPHNLSSLSALKCQHVKEIPDYVPEKNIDSAKQNMDKVVPCLKEDDIFTNAIEEDTLNMSDDELLSEIKSKESMTFYKPKPEAQINITLLEGEEKKPVAKAVRPKCKTSSKYKSVKHSLGTQIKNEAPGESKQYTTVVFTEEEMLRIRQDKSNQPNYKKLPHKCSSCVQGFLKREAYEQHMARSHEQTAGAHVCTVCLSRFRSATARDRHRRAHFELHKCNLCKYESSSRAYLESHVVAKHGSDSAGKIHCPVCKEVFSTAEELATHTAARHRVACDQCSAHFNKRDTLRSHKRRVHRAARAHACAECGLTFPTASRYESHLARHGPRVAQALAYCAPCGVQYKNIYIYRNHLRNSSKHAEDAHTCPVCNARLASKVYLKRHIEYYHLKDSRYSCNECEKIFISNWQLQYHRQLRHGALRTRNHACADCGKKFFTLRTLQCHAHTHSAERSFMCAACGDTFKQRSALYNHTRLLHKGEQRNKT